MYVLFSEDHLSTKTTFDLCCQWLAKIALSKRSYNSHAELQFVLPIEKIYFDWFKKRISKFYLIFVIL